MKNESKGVSLFQAALRIPSDEEAATLFIQAYDELQADAARGNGEAMFLLAAYFQVGFPPVSRDLAKRKALLRQAFESNYAPAGRELFAILSNKDSPHYDAGEAEMVQRRGQELEAEQSGKSMDKAS